MRSTNWFHPYTRLYWQRKNRVKQWRECVKRCCPSWFRGRYGWRRQRLADLTHAGYSDESHWNQGRYRTLGLVTLPIVTVDEALSDAQMILDKSNVKEFAWKKLRTDKQEAVAKQLCRLASRLAYSRKIRVDTLIWDVSDSRHKIQGRDDTANLARMYYHLLINVIERRWPTGCYWEMRPDNRTDMDWDTLEKCLQYPSRGRKNASRTLLDGKSGVGGVAPPQVNPVDSEDDPLIQIADLFAGLAAFSWNRHVEYQRWRLKQLGQLDMFDDGAHTELSRSEAYKARILQFFEGQHRRHSLGIIQSKQEGLKTRDPTEPINFWLYVPQIEEDKAPRRYE